MNKPLRGTEPRLLVAPDDSAIFRRSRLFILGSPRSFKISSSAACGSPCVQEASMAERLLFFEHGQIPIPDNDVVALDQIAPELRDCGECLRYLAVLWRMDAHRYRPAACAGPHPALGRKPLWRECGSERHPAYPWSFNLRRSAEALANAWDVPVYVHPPELPYVTGKSAYPPPDPTVGGGCFGKISAFPGSGSGDGSMHHTAGYVCLFRESDRVLNCRRCRRHYPAGVAVGGCNPASRTAWPARVHDHRLGVLAAVRT